jgi:pyridoxamine 5'-phosphate oxidase
VCGRADRAERRLAETLFAQRDRPHQLQALVSRQGEPIADVAGLRERLAVAEREVGDDPIPCPADWGAFRIRPDVIEYWTAAPDAMHDRSALVRDRGRWRVTRLAP